MQTASPFATPVRQQVASDAVLPAEIATEMERLALAVLNAAQICEIEAGLQVHVTPSMSVETLAGLARLDDFSTALLLDVLLEAGFVSWRRQRLLLTRPEALYRLALGAAPL